MTDNYLILAALGIISLLGASAQRVTGMGFALITSPLLVVILGPLDGILLVNALGVVATLTAFTQVFRLVEYRRVFMLMVPAVIAMVPGVWMANHLPSAVLSMTVGIMTLAALVGGMVVGEWSFFNRPSGIGLAGGISGFMNVTAGVGGPAIAAYALASRWGHSSFVASAQFYFLCTDIGTLAAYRSLPTLDVWEWAVCCLGLALGVLLGNLMVSRIPPRACMRGVTVLAYAGAVLIVVKGAVQLATQS